MKSLCEQYEIGFRKCFFKKEYLLYDSNEHLVSFNGNYDFILLSFCYVSLMFHLHYLFYIFIFYIFCLRLDKDFDNNNNNNNNNNNRKGRCFWHDDASLLFLYLSKIRKVVTNGQKSPKGSTPNNKTFLFQVPGT